MRVNAIFLGGNKRVSMAEKFIASAGRLGIDLQIKGYELSKMVALAKVAEIFEGERWNSPRIYSHLASLYEPEAVNLLVPFVDGAVEVASRAAGTFQNVFAPVGSPQSAITMFDKVLADAEFRRHGIAVPEVFELDGMRFPVIAKPRKGSASKGLIVIYNDGEWNRLNIHVDEYLVQEYIANREEFTVDCYRTVREGEILCVSPRKRLEVAGGEVVSTVTVDNREVSELAVKTLLALDLRGAVTVQVIHDMDSGRYMVMEVNPRLGGGAVATVCAGGDLPGMILSEAVGMVHAPASVRSGILVRRYLSEIYFDTNG